MGDAMKALAVEVKTTKGAARRRVAVHYLYVAPALTATLAVMIYPLFYSLWLSTQRFTLKRPDEIAFVGLANYVNALADEVFRTSIVNTVLQVVGAGGVEI